MGGLSNGWKILEAWLSIYPLAWQIAGKVQSWKLFHLPSFASLLYCWPWRTTGLAQARGERGRPHLVCWKIPILGGFGLMGHLEHHSRSAQRSRRPTFLSTLFIHAGTLKTGAEQGEILLVGVGVTSYWYKCKPKPSPRYFSVSLIVHSGAVFLVQGNSKCMCWASAHYSVFFPPCCLNVWKVPSILGAIT